MSILMFIISPTRFLAKLLLDRNIISVLHRLVIWNCIFYFISLSFYITSVGYIGKHIDLPTYVLSGAAVLAFWRVNELVIAFFIDALDKIEGGTSRLKLARAKLLTLLILGYLEVICQFGILHFCIDKLYERYSHPGAYTKGFLTAFDAGYFSGITITTTGFGDFAPCRSIARAATVYEAVVGIILIAMSLAAYLSFKQSEARVRDEGRTEAKNLN